MLRVFEPEFIGNFHQILPDVILCRLSGFFFDQVAEVIGRQIQLIGPVLHRRQTDSLRFIGIKIGIQQQFDIGCNQHFTVLV